MVPKYQRLAVEERRAPHEKIEEGSLERVFLQNRRPGGQALENSAVSFCESSSTLTSFTPMFSSSPKPRS